MIVISAYPGSLFFFNDLYKCTNKKYYERKIIIQ